MDEVTILLARLYGSLEMVDVTITHDLRVLKRMDQALAYIKVYSHTRGVHHPYTLAQPYIGANVSPLTPKL